MANEKENLIGNAMDKVGFKVSLMPKETKAPSPKARLRLFYIIFFAGLALVVVVSAILWAIVFLRQSKITAANNNLAAINQKISDLNSSFETAKKEQATLTTLAGIIENHIYSSNIFDWLQTDTLPQVSWGNLNFTSGGSFSLTGTASTYEMFVAQVETIKNDPLVTAVSFSGVNGDFDENKVMKGVNFNLSVSLKPDYLKK